MIFIKKYIQNLSIWACNRYQHNCTSREARYMAKIIQKGKKNLFKSQILPTSLSDYARKTLYRSDTRRTTVLSKVFLEQICDIMATGEYADELDSRGIQIVKVKVAPSFSIIYVYWIHTKDIDELETNKFLTKASAFLRHELTTVKVMGEIPEIRFTKHEDMILQQQTEDLLDKLAALKCEEQEPVLEKDEEIVYVQENKPNSELVIPPMLQNIFGLDRAMIINKVITAKNNSNIVQSELINHERGQTADVKNVVFDKKALSKVLFHERYQLKKLQKENKKFLELITSNEDDDDDSCIEYDKEDFECDNYNEIDGEGEEKYEIYLTEDDERGDDLK